MCFLDAWKAAKGRAKGAAKKAALKQRDIDEAWSIYDEFLSVEAFNSREYDYAD